ncbi:hypothetical protein HII28_13860 [Planctomonas sp. JC2975]|uniref:hypothetical protein n=1 Tax=Planctomonas sp. JC2975 TaxID=2729626 RepID=UPI00147617B8|nr:hypothetical protein [Planctomonas sp. JC2975]NNC12957.1 hypothetical protein [Planctomonas sp. JC2975]
MTTVERASRGRAATTVGDFLILASAMAGYVIVAMRQSLLPAKFSFDGDRIHSIALGTGSAFGDKAFGNVAWLYAQLDLAAHPLLAGMLGYSLFLVILLGVWARVRRNEPSVFTVFVACASLVFAAVYLGYYTKDICVLPIVAAVLFLPRHWWADLVIVAMMLGYAAWFRSYWLPVALLFVAYRVVRIQRRSLGFILVAIVLAVLALGLAIYVVYGTDPDIYRSSVNDTRSLDPNAQSIITPILTFAEPWSGLLNNVLTAFFLLVPIPLLLSGGGLYYGIITLVLTVIWGSTYVGIARLRRVDESSAPHGSITSVARAAAILVSFLCVQALFEPDYGSAVRHVTPLLPAALLICGTALRTLPKWRELREGASEDPASSALFGPASARIQAGA